MAHSNQVREFVLSNKGIQLIDVYTGTGSVVTGSARVAQLERERVEAALEQQQAESRRTEIQHRRAAAAAQVETLQADIAAADRELQRFETTFALSTREAARIRGELARGRMADADRPRGISNGA
jgi:circadian clock protein KaiC